jgi:hypothetical protein
MACKRITNGSWHCKRQNWSFFKLYQKKNHYPLLAAPVLVGKTETIELAKPYPWKWIAILATIGFVVFWLMRRKFVQKQRPKEKVSSLNMEK